MDKYFLEFSYVIASVLFILGLKMLSSPKTARKGNLWAGFGMGLAILRLPQTGPLLLARLRVEITP